MNSEYLKESKRHKERLEKLRDKVLERFSRSEPTDLVFNDLFLLADGVERELDKGVFVVVTSISLNVLHIDCHMKAGIVLSRHFHSDYYEFFMTNSGVLIDNVNGESMDGKMYELGEVHEPYSIKDWVGEVYCIKASNKHDRKLNEVRL